MTAQMPDHVRFEGRDWILIGVAGASLFEPAAVDLVPVMMSTACYRGYTCTYSVLENRLMLTELLLGRMSTCRGEEITTETELFGSRPVWDRIRFGFSWPDLAVPVPFSGGLLLGHGPARGARIPGTHHPARSYEHAVELSVEGGTVAGHHDRSPALAAIRARACEARQAGVGPPGDPETELGQAFAFDYIRGRLPY